MGKKKFEDQVYDPLAQDLLRDAAKVGRAPTAPVAPIEPPLAQAREPASKKVLELPTQPRRQPEPRERAKKQTQNDEPVAPQRSNRFIAKRFELTRDEDIEFSSFLSRVQKASGVRVPVSVLVRACCRLLQQGEAALVADIRRAPFRKLPSTGDDLGYADFEERWVELVRSAIKKTTREAAEGLS